MRKCNSKTPVNITLQVIGGKWKAILLWHISQQTYRFNELSRLVSGITQKMLTQELREMESDGLIRRKIYPVVPPKVEYSITRYGRTLEPVLKSMAIWGEKHRNKYENRLNGSTD